MRILIIGGTGFISRWVVRELASTGNEITVFHRGQTKAELPVTVSHLRGDRRVLRNFAPAIRAKQPELVLDTCAYDREDVIELKLALADMACSVALLSSMDVYRAYGIFCGLEAEPPIAEPFDEDAPLRTALYPYRGQAQATDELNYRYDKIPVEQFVLEEMDRPATILRLGKVYGPGDPQNHVAGYAQMLSKPIELSESKARWRWSRIYVENAAEAVAKAITIRSENARIYNVADEPALSEEEWMMAIAQASGMKANFVKGEAGGSESVRNWGQHLVANTSRLRTEVGWRESVQLEEALRRTTGRKKLKD